MKICENCGTKNFDINVICERCHAPLKTMVHSNFIPNAVENNTQGGQPMPSGYYYSEDKSTKKSALSTVAKVAKIFMIIESVFRIISAICPFVMLLVGCVIHYDRLFVAGAILVPFTIIPCIVVCLMTSHYSYKIANGEQVGVGFKICTLFFVSIIAGILMLCDNGD